MSSSNYPQPPSHKTFEFGQVTIDSNFDSGNCSGAEKVSHNNFLVWIGTDNPKNNYRTWFHFSVSGLKKGSYATFKIKNMQNQSKLLSQGLVPVYRQQSSSEWKRIKQRINLSSIEYYEGWIQWSFRHLVTSQQKTFFAFFYPWSNEDNFKFLNEIEAKAKLDKSIYFFRTHVINTLQGRPLEFLVISSTKNSQGLQKINDQYLFKNKESKIPLSFSQNKKAIVIGARVHPGQVPGSHVICGIIQQLIEDSTIGKLLRDNFVFYIFPIFNPDGVARGHYRVDTNGINLNRCYITPSAKYHPTIYAVKKIIMHLHAQEKFFSFLDLHAHATRKGTFIYGNSIDQLNKQMLTCIFPKVLSMNSIDFEYEGSNFTEKNMNCKDKADHMSKQGSGRVAMYRATKNPLCWTLQCNYNMSRVHNFLEKQRQIQYQNQEKTTQGNLDEKIIVNYRQPPQKQSKQFFTIQTYRKLGRQVCLSYLDLIEKNPSSRVNNPKNHFKNLTNLKLNLAFALMKMAPTRFEGHYRKIYNAISNAQNQEIKLNGLKGLYFLLIKNAKIESVSNFLKDGDLKTVILPEPKKKTVCPKTQRVKYSSLLQKGNAVKIRKRNISINKEMSEKCLQSNPIEAVKDNDFYRNSIDMAYQTVDDKEQKLTKQKILNLFSEKLGMKPQKSSVLKKESREKRRQKIQKMSVKLEEFRMIGVNNLRHSIFQKEIRMDNNERSSKVKFKIQQFPTIGNSSKINGFNYNHQEQRVIRKGTSARLEVG